jgi:hypothetical protein
MGFLAPWFLAGAAAVGLPIYLHLLRRSSTTPRPFSSLMFFEPRTQSSIRHRRLRYLLLLSLRMLLLVLLAIAFANPFVTRPVASVTAERVVLLVLDTSFSMRAGTRLADAKREALAVLASRRSSERVEVMAIDSELHPLTQPTNDSATLRAAIDAVTASDARGSFAELGRSIRLMAENAHGPIELHLFSDLQRSNMASSFSEMAFPDAVTLMLHAVVTSAVPNWTVESVTAPGQLWGTSKEGTSGRVQAVIAGYATPAASRTVSLVVNGKTVATSSVQVPASGRATVEFPSLDVPYGFSRGEVRIDSADALAADDNFVFAVERSDPRPVLFVHSASDSRAPLYFGAALRAAAESAFAPQFVTPEQVATLALPKYAFVVLSNLPRLESAVESNLEKYVQGGGSVLVALGTAAAARGRLEVFGELVKEVHDYTRGQARGRERFLTVGDADPSHPSVGKNDYLSGVKFYYAISVDPSNSRVVARLTDQTPIVLDKRIGEGRVMLFGSGLENLTNDFPLHPGFVAFVDETARYLAGAERRTGSRIVGSYLELRTAQEQGLASTLGVEVVDPDGRRPLSLEEARVTQSFHLTRLGFYQLRLANGRQNVVGVNPDRRESNLEVMPADVQALWTGNAQKKEPAGASTDVAAAPAQVKQERFGLWWYLMIAGLAAALSESWLASRYLSTQREEAVIERKP